MLLPGVAQAGTAVGEAAPAFSSTTVNGRLFSLASYKGDKPVYIKFWATWCSYCKAEMPHFKQLREQYGEAVKFITVNVGMNDSVANINAFFNQQGYRVPTIFDAKGDLTREYGVIGTPQHVLIDRSGKVAYRTFLATDELDERLALWAETSGKPENENVFRYRKH